MRSDEPEVLILLSGGIDSTACLHFFLSIGRPTQTLFVDYGQVAHRHEALASQRIADYYSVEHNCVTVTHGREKSIGLINARNLFLVSVALMERVPTISVIAIGVHAGTPYPDCSPEFVSALERAVNISEGQFVHIATPFLKWHKQDVYAYAKGEGLPLNLTHSCEAGGEHPCGKCPSCKDRELLNAC